MKNKILALILLVFLLNVSITDAQIQNRLVNLGNLSDVSSSTQKSDDINIDKISDIIKIRLENIYKHWENIFSYMDSLSDRTLQRIEQIEEKTGSKLEESRQLLEKAKTKIDEAKKIIEGSQIEAEKYLINNSSQEKIKIRIFLSEAKESIKSAKQALIETLQSLKDKSSNK